MTDLPNTPDPRPAADAGRNAAKTTLATGALVAAFGVASCCALPLMLGAFGVGSAALLGIAVVVGPYQIYVLAAAVVCLCGAAFVMWRQRRAEACAASGRRARPVLDRFAQLAIVLAMALLAATFWLEPPL